jgi:hypothetical protein
VGDTGECGQMHLDLLGLSVELVHVDHI